MAWGMNPCEDDPPLVTVLAEDSPKGKKDYLCCMCGKWIKAGLRHRKTVYLDDDVSPSKFHSIRYHINCEEDF